MPSLFLPIFVDICCRCQNSRKNDQSAFMQKDNITVFFSMKTKCDAANPQKHWLITFFLFLWNLNLINAPMD